MTYDETLFMVETPNSFRLISYWKSLLLDNEIFLRDTGVHSFKVNFVEVSKMLKFKILIISICIFISMSYVSANSETRQGAFVISHQLNEYEFQNKDSKIKNKSRKSKESIRRMKKVKKNLYTKYATYTNVNVDAIASGHQTIGVVIPQTREMVYFTVKHNYKNKSGNIVWSGVNSFRDGEAFFIMNETQLNGQFSVDGKSYNIFHFS